MSPIYFLALCVLAMPTDVLAQPAAYDLTPVTVQPDSLSPRRVSWRLRGASTAAPTRVQLMILDAAGNTAHDSGERSCAGDGDDSCGYAHTFPASVTAQLARNAAYTYRVRVASAEGWSAWSAGVPFLTGPGTARTDWPGASWVCSSANATDARTTMLRSEFALPADARITSAVMSIIGLGQFRASLNGEFVSDDYNTPPWTKWSAKLLFSTYDVTAAVRAGLNVVGVVLGNGMYNVPNPSPRYTKWVGSAGPRMLLLTLRVMLSDGSVLNVTSTPGAWTATDDGPVTFTHQYAGEDLDLSRTVEGWDSPGFDPLANRLVQWAPAVDCSGAAPAGTLIAADFPPVKVVEEIPVVFINTTLASKGSWVVDFGRNFAGFPTLTVANVSSGWGLRVTPSETLRSDGTIDQSSGGSPAYWNVFPNNTGSATNITLAPFFWWYGWRWIFVELIPSPPPSTAASKLSSSAPSINVTSAVFGQNCATQGDETAAVESWCGGKSKCTYDVCVCGDNTCGAGAPPCIPDPAQNCAKSFAVFWACGDGRDFSCFLPAEADDHSLDLTCGPTPPSCAPVPIPPSGATIVSALGHFTRSSVTRVGTWSSANEWVNRIHGITVEAIEANLQTVLTDCPHRERLGWLEVSHLMAPSIAYNFDISALWAKIARDTVDSQTADGMVPDIAPEYTVFSGGFRDSPEWGSAAILNPFWLHALYNDSDTLSATYNTSVQYVNYLLSKIDPTTGLLAYGLGDWIPVVNSPTGVTATGTLVQDFDALAAAATVLGKPADAANFTALARTVGAAYEKAFSSAGAYPTQCAAGYALTLNITADVAAARAYLLNDVRAKGNVTTSGEVGNRYAMMALGDMGQAGVDAVWDSLLRTDAPGYGYMLTMGETALAESWFDNPRDSHLHAMYGHVDEFLFAYVAGIRQVAGTRGWAHVVLAPKRARDLDWLDVSFESPRGLLRVAFNATRVAPGRVAVEMRATVPPGVVADIVHPLTRRSVRVIGGKHVLREEGGD